MLSIQDLPIELLIHIFQCFSPTDRGDIRVAHVCGLWRDTLQKTPQFWTGLLTISDIISAKYHERDIRFWHSCIHRTSTQPLRLRLGGWDIDLLKAIPEHSPRLTYLQVHWKMVYPKEAQRRLLAMPPMPALEELRLSCDHPAPETTFRDIDVTRLVESASIADKYPRLRSLKINPDFFIPSMVVGSVTTLFVYHGHLSMTLLRAALVQCPRLQYLRIDNAYFWDFQSLLRGPPVVLPHLRDLCLRYPTAPDELGVMLLVTHIRCPSITRMDVSFCYPTLVGVLHPVSLPIMQTLTWLVVEVYDLVDRPLRTCTLSVKGHVGRNDLETTQLTILNQGFRWWKRCAGAAIVAIHSITELMGSSTVTDLVIRLLDRQLDMTHVDTLSVGSIRERKPTEKPQPTKR